MQRGAEAPCAGYGLVKRTRFILPREARIRRRAEFTACYDRGRRLYSAHFLVFVLSGVEPDGRTRTGTAVSRKVGNAVARNRIKRLLREFFRLHREALPPHADIVVVAKKHAAEAGLSLAGTVDELLPLFQRQMRRAPAASGGL